MSYILKTSITLFLVTFLALPIFARDILDAKREIIVKFTDTVIVLPDSARTAGKEAIAMREDPRGELLYNSNLVEIVEAFKRRDPADSIGINQFGDTILKPRLDDYYKLVFPDTISRNEMYDSLHSLDDSSEIIKNGEILPESGTAPNDPLYSTHQWNLHHDSLYGINIEGAWEYTMGDSDIIIGIIDPGGIRFSHDDLYPRVIGDLEFDGSHGTEVAGIAAASTNNNTLVAGVCPKSNIYLGFVPNVHDVEDVYDEIIGAVDAGAVALNNSWGTADFVGGHYGAMMYAYKMNCVVVCSKGNSGSDEIHYPSDYDEKIISVGSHDNFGQWSQFSNRGHDIDVVAPGENITVLRASSNSDWSSNGWGTSLSAPHVTGLAALLYSYDDSMYNDDVENIIKLSAIDIDEYPASEGYDDYTGWGRIHAKAAFDILQPPNRLTRISEGGGYVHSVTENLVIFFLDIQNIADGLYLTDRYCIRKWISFEDSCLVTPHVWGRGAGTIGYSGANPNYGIGYTGIVPGTITNEGCEIQTFVYHVYTYPYPQEVGWFPCGVSGVRFAITLLEEFTLEPPPFFNCSRDYYDEFIKVYFEDPNAYEDGWVIERKDATTEQWQVLDTIPNNPNPYYSYEDYYPVGGETYAYRVKPFIYGRDEIAYSDEDTVTARPLRPTSISLEVTDYSGPVPSHIGCDADPSKPVSSKITDGLPPGDTLPDPSGCHTLLGDDITVRWTPNNNQKYPIVDFLVKRYFPPSPVGDYWHAGTDTCLFICPNPKNADVYIDVFAISSIGDTSVDITGVACTGLENSCPDTPTKDFEEENVIDDLKTALYQNYPNPFNPTTEIKFSLSHPSSVILDIYNVLGRKIKTIANDNFEAGYHSVLWDGTDEHGISMSSGVYFYKIKAGSFTETRKMLIIK